MLVFFLFNCHQCGFETLDFLTHQFVSSVNTALTFTHTHTHPQPPPWPLPTSQRKFRYCCSVSVKAVNVVWSKVKSFFLSFFSYNFCANPLTSSMQQLVHLHPVWIVNPTPPDPSGWGETLVWSFWALTVFNRFDPLTWTGLLHTNKGMVSSQHLCLRSFLWVVVAWNKGQVSAGPNLISLAHVRKNTFFTVTFVNTNL